MVETLPELKSLIFTGGAFVLALSIIVFIHEFGHYIVGRWTGIRAEVFSIGFGKPLLSGYDRHGTKWQLALIPLGGYVKFLGDAGVASDKASDILEEMDEETLRHTMHGAPLYARALTVAAGPVFNFILSIIVFAGMILWVGEIQHPPVIDSFNQTPYGQGELQKGDKIIAVNGETVETLGDVYVLADREDSVGGDTTYTVVRDGTTLDVTGPFPLPPLVDNVQPRSAAVDAGLKPGDVILSVDGQPLPTFRELKEMVTASEGRMLELLVWREGQELTFNLEPRQRDLPKAEGGFETRWLIGFGGELVFDAARARPSIPEALMHGVTSTWSVISDSMMMLGSVISGAIGTCNIGGVLTIAETSGVAASHGLLTFIGFIALLSTAIGMVNLFPIPILDGGHLVFHVYEALRGRPPSDRALQALFTLGLVFVLSLMVLALANDIVCR